MDCKGILRKCPDTLLPVSMMGARQQAEAPQKRAVEVQGSGLLMIQALNSCSPETAPSIPHPQVHSAPHSGPAECTCGCGGR